MQVARALLEERAAARGTAPATPAAGALAAPGGTACARTLAGLLAYREAALVSQVGVGLRGLWGRADVMWV